MPRTRSHLSTDTRKPVVRLVAEVRQLTRHLKSEGDLAQFSGVAEDLVPVPGGDILPVLVAEAVPVGGGQSAEREAADRDGREIPLGRPEREPFEIKDDGSGRCDDDVAAPRVAVDGARCHRRQQVLIAATNVNAIGRSG